MHHIETEKELIESFKNDFFKKMGYYPVVITNITEIDESIENVKIDFPKIMTLKELEDLFTDVLPILYSKTLTLRSKKRCRKLVELRAIYIYLAKCMGYRIIDISHYLNKHHSTIIYNEEMFNNMMSTCRRFRNTFEKVFMHIRNNYKSNDELSTMVYFNKAWHQSQSIILSGLLPVQD